jgi:thymidylate synthase
METSMKQYHDLLNDILNNGVQKNDRTGVGTFSVFARQLRFDLMQGFPAITTKKLAWRSVVSELLWFLEGTGDERRLREILHGSRDSASNTIWTENAEASYWIPKAKFLGDLGRVYGVQWRHWRTNTATEENVVIKDSFDDWYSGPINFKETDQIKNLIEGIKKDPDGRRHIVNSWNAGEIDQMALPPCHVMCQFYVADGKLSCHMYQRSVDVFLGLPFNIASYALLTHMIAQVSELDVGELIISTGDTHIYKNHIDQVNQQLTNEEYPLPQLWLNPDIKDIDGFTMDDIKLQGYKSHGTIKAAMAV